MPIYEYLCSSCGTVTEKLESINNENRDTECEKCGKTASRKISATAYHLSGSGFHNTDYKGACNNASPACAGCPSAK